jgi:hypothetical protein
MSEDGQTGGVRSMHALDEKEEEDILRSEKF